MPWCVGCLPSSLLQQLTASAAVVGVWTVHLTFDTLLLPYYKLRSIGPKRPLRKSMVRKKDVHHKKLGISKHCTRGTAVANATTMPDLRQAGPVLVQSIGHASLLL